MRIILVITIGVLAVFAIIGSIIDYIKISNESSINKLMHTKKTNEKKRD